MDEICKTNRYKLVKRYARLGRLCVLGNLIKEHRFSTVGEFESAAGKWLEELDLMYGKQDERPPWDHTEEEAKALLEKMEHPDVYVRCPRCGKEILWEHIGNSIRIGCVTTHCIYTGIRGL